MVVTHEARWNASLRFLTFGFLIVSCAIRLGTAADSSSAVDVEKTYTSERYANPKLFDQYATKWSAERKDYSVKVISDAKSQASCAFTSESRAYFPVPSNSTPPLLYAFPGSGEVLVRGLIETATRHFTGSIHAATTTAAADIQDLSLFYEFPAEGVCDNTVAAVAANPQTIPFEYLKMPSSSSGAVANSSTEGGICHFDRVIILLRDPFETIWTEFQRLAATTAATAAGTGTGTGMGGSSSRSAWGGGGVRKEQAFDRKLWTAQAAVLSHHYYNAWSVQYTEIIRTVVKFDDILFMRYEDLKDPTTRGGALSTLLTFLGYKDVPHEELKCAFTVMDKKLIMTTTPNTATQGYKNKNRDKKKHRSSATASSSAAAAVDMVTMHDAYKPQLVCRMWALYKDYASLFGYKIFGDTQCGDGMETTPIALTDNMKSEDMKRTERIQRATVQQQQQQKVGAKPYLATAVGGGGRIRDDDSKKLSIFDVYSQSLLAKPAAAAAAVRANPFDKPIVTTKQQCSNKFAHRRYIPSALQRVPPLLYTFPGSGNTWCRLLVEYSTSFYTGAVYDDMSLLAELPGELKCNREVAIVKAHPFTHPFGDLYRGNYSSDNDKCKEGGVPKFTRAILLIRDPFDSIWSEFQRQVSNSHVGVIKWDKFSWEKWVNYAGYYSHMYRDMWEIEYAQVVRSLSQENVLFLRYEDLHNLNPIKRLSTLRTVTKFLNFPVASTERLECAFKLSESRRIYRPSNVSAVRKEDIFLKYFVCRMWAVFGSYARKFGYAPYKNFSCNGYLPIERGSVGLRLSPVSAAAIKMVPTAKSLLNVPPLDPKVFYRRYLMMINKLQQTKDGPAAPIVDINTCRAQYRAQHRTSLSTTEQATRIPPMLYSFQGTGDTDIRMLSEFSTGVYTGSVYGDMSLIRILPGEDKCDLSVSMITVRPFTHPFSALKNGVTSGGGGGGDKCARGQVKRFTRAVLLLRDPYDSIWNEYNRMKMKSHFLGIPKGELNVVDWQGQATELAKLYLDMWATQYSDVLRAFLEKDVLFIRYEDFGDNTRKNSALRLLIEFLGFPPVTPEKVACSFAMMEAHKISANSSITTTTTTTDSAYPRGLVCKLWNIFGAYASQFGYAPLRNITCGTSSAGGSTAGGTVISDRIGGGAAIGSKARQQQQVAGKPSLMRQEPRPPQKKNDWIWMRY